MILSVAIVCLKPGQGQDIVNKNSGVVYSGEKEIDQLTEFTFSERWGEGIRVFDVRNPEKNMYTSKRYQDIEKTEYGYQAYIHFGGEESYALDENFDVLFGGEAFRVMTEFYDGLAFVVKKNGQRDFMNRNGEMVISMDKSDNASHFNEGKVLINKGNDLVCYDIKGNVIFRINDMNITIGDNGYEDSYYINGVAAVKTKDGYGLIDTSGDFVIEPMYDYMRLLDNGRMIVSCGGKWGIALIEKGWK